MIQIEQVVGNAYYADDAAAIYFVTILARVAASIRRASCALIFRVCY